jgi:hypothetical protein
MINELEELLPEIQEDVSKTLREESFETWGSLIINKRKPHTYRVFKNFGEHRVCLHKFKPCDPKDCFLHPHPWPGAFLMLGGEYIHRIGYTPDLEQGDPIMLYEEFVRPYTIYQITNKQTWHSVQPTINSYTVMLNGEPWDEPHGKTRTTKGKDLDVMTNEELKNHLSSFWTLFRNYFDQMPSIWRA